MEKALVFISSRTISGDDDDKQGNTLVGETRTTFGGRCDRIIVFIACHVEIGELVGLFERM